VAAAAAYEPLLSIIAWDLNNVDGWADYTGPFGQQTTRVKLSKVGSSHSLGLFLSDEILQSAGASGTRTVKANNNPTNAKANYIGITIALAGSGSVKLVQPPLVIAAQPPASFFD
jgi:hypothetical protein